MRRNSDAPGSCRIERKRAHDREAQRASRAKTKQYIAHLEKTVVDLTEQSGDNRANYLAQHASQQSQEIDKLQALLNKIRTLVQDTVKSDEDKSPDKADGGSLVERVTAARPTSTEAFSAMNWDTRSEDQWLDIAKQSVGIEQQEVQQVPPQITSTSSRNLVVLGINLYCENNDDTTYFPRLNELIELIEKTPDNLSSHTEDQDILIRAIVHGWDASERVHHFDIVWRFLRAFDEGLWYRAQPIERFAHFWNMRSTILHKIQPKNQPRRKMATFMSPTIGQRSRSQPSVVDYFGWPQVRKHLQTAGIKQCSNRGAVAFTESFRFVWPWEVRDAYRIHKPTGLYSFSDAFLKNFNDISSFRLLANHLIPFEVQPVSRTEPTPEDLDNEDTSVDDEFSYQEPTFQAAAVTNKDENGMHHEPSAEDWMATLASLHEAGRHEIHNVHAFQPVPQGASLSQWGGTREPVGFF